MKHPMMKCGHAANATDGNGKPTCVICIGIHPGASEVDDVPRNLEGRSAKCQCGRLEASNPDKLAFFEHRPTHDFDLYYCGCRGWD